MEAILVLLVLGTLAVLVVGGICGLVAVAQNRALRKQLASFESRLRSLEHRPHRETPVTRPAEQACGETKGFTPAETPQPAPEAPRVTPTQAPPPIPTPATRDEIPPSLLEAASPSSPLPPEPVEHRPSFEMVLGTKWLAWVGVLMFAVAIAFLLKYLYGRGVIPESARLAIGTGAGLALLGAGEYCRRRDWTPLFQTLTGGAVAVFYLCIFFACTIYELVGVSVGFPLAMLVTALAVVMAVAHNAIAIAVLGVVGGYLSPVLLSTGENSPYILFSYIVVLDLVAMGAAYFRRWRLLNVLCLTGTTVVYLMWFTEFFDHTQMLPALAYATVFYLMFLLIPTVHGIVRKSPRGLEELILIAGDVLVSFCAYYRILMEDHRTALGFVVVGQALILLALFYVWRQAHGEDRVAGSLLTISLVLVAIAIPIHLRAYGVPVAWAVQGFVLVFLGLQFKNMVCRMGGVVALVLAAGGLLARMPMHTAPFTPVFNGPFISWAAVIAGAAVAAHLLHKRAVEQWLDPRLALGSFLLGFTLLCVLLTSETALQWDIQKPGEAPSMWNALAILWSLIPVCTALAIRRADRREWWALPLTCYGFGVFIFLAGLVFYEDTSTLPALNAGFPSRLAVVLALWLATVLLRERGLGFVRRVPGLIGHVLLVILVAFEFHRWADVSKAVSDDMGMSLISAAWAVHAFILIWLGLFMDSPERRYAGFALFGLAIAKTVFIDMQDVEPVYRILSFAASGLLLLGAAFFYQRYSGLLMQRLADKATPPATPEEGDVGA